MKIFLVSVSLITIGIVIYLICNYFWNLGTRQKSFSFGPYQCNEHALTISYSFLWNGFEGVSEGSRVSLVFDGIALNTAAHVSVDSGGGVTRDQRVNLNLPDFTDFSKYKVGSWFDIRYTPKILSIGLSEEQKAELVQCINSHATDIFSDVQERMIKAGYPRMAFYFPFIE